jgi:hypothetical protein
LSVKIINAELNFFIYLYLSRTGDKTEDSSVQSGSRAPVQASPDMVIAANCYVFIFGKKFWIRRKIQKFLCRKIM